MERVGKMNGAQLLIRLFIVGSLLSFATSSPIKGGRGDSSHLFRVKGGGRTNSEKPSWVRQPSTPIRQESDDFQDAHQKTTHAIDVTDARDYGLPEQGEASHTGAQEIQSHSSGLDHHDVQQQSVDSAEQGFDRQTGALFGQGFDVTEAPQTRIPTTLTTPSLAPDFGARIKSTDQDLKTCATKGGCGSTKQSSSTNIVSDSRNFGVRTTTQPVASSTFDDQHALVQQHDEDKSSFGQQSFDAGSQQVYPEQQDTQKQFDVPAGNGQFFDDYDTSQLSSPGHQEHSGHVEGLLHPDFEQHGLFSQQQGTTGFSGVKQPSRDDQQQQPTVDGQSRISAGAPVQQSFDAQTPTFHQQTSFQNPSQISASQDYRPSEFMTQTQSFQDHAGNDQSGSHGEGQYVDDGQYHDDGQYQFYANPLDGLRYNVPGNPGEDYPILYQVPDTSFNCQQQAFSAGIFGDTEASCQVFHVCKEGGGQDSFLCPNGTVFNQQYFVCDWWYNYRCSDTPSFYSLNADLYWDLDRFTPSQVLNVPIANSEQPFSSGAVDTFSSSSHATSGQGTEPSQKNVFKNTIVQDTTDNRNRNQFDQRFNGFIQGEPSRDSYQGFNQGFQQQQVITTQSVSGIQDTFQPQNRVSAFDNKQKVPEVKEQVVFQPTSSDSRTNVQPESNEGTRYPDGNQNAQNMDFFQQQIVPDRLNPNSVVDRSDEQQLLSIPFVDENPNTLTDSREPDEIQSGQRDKNAVPFSFSQQTTLADTVAQDQEVQQDVSEAFDRNAQNEFVSGAQDASFGSMSHDDQDLGVHSGSTIRDNDRDDEFQNQNQENVLFDDQLRVTDSQNEQQPGVFEQQEHVSAFDVNDHSVSNQERVSDDRDFTEDGQQQQGHTPQTFFGKEEGDDQQFIQQEFHSNKFEGQTKPRENTIRFQGDEISSTDSPRTQQEEQQDTDERISFQNPDAEEAPVELSGVNVQQEFKNPVIQQEFVSTDFHRAQEQDDRSMNSVPQNEFFDSPEQVAFNSNRKSNEGSQQEDKIGQEPQVQIPFEEQQQDIFRNVNAQQNNQGQTAFMNEQVSFPRDHSMDAQNNQHGQNFIQEKIPAKFDNRQDNKPHSFVQGDNRVWQQVHQQRQTVSFNEFSSMNSGSYDNTKAGFDRPSPDHFQGPNIRNAGRDGNFQQQPLNFRPYGQNPQQQVTPQVLRNPQQDHQRQISGYSNNNGGSNQNFFMTNGHQIHSERPQQHGPQQNFNNIAREQPRPFVNQGPFQQDHRVNQNQFVDQRPQQAAYDQNIDQNQRSFHQNQRPQFNQNQYQAQRPVEQRYIAQSHEEYVPENVYFPVEQSTAATEYSARRPSGFVQVDDAAAYSRPEQISAARSYNGWKPIVKE